MMLRLQFNNRVALSSCNRQVSTEAASWVSWNSVNVKRIEDHIEYDLTFDGYLVDIERVSKPSRALCSRPFVWKITIKVDIDAEELELDKKPAGTRFKVARSDASVKTIQSTIERVFGLPSGCVILQTPDKKKAKPSSSIKALRGKWKNSD
jgi:hypothetical protein